jgi:hypothetical protein
MQSLSPSVGIQRPSSNPFICPSSPFEMIFCYYVVGQYPSGLTVLVGGVRGCRDSFEIGTVESVANYIRVAVCSMVGFFFFPLALAFAPSPFFSLSGPSVANLPPGQNRSAS